MTDTTIITQASMVKTKRDAKRYLDDVNDSAHYPGRVLIELVSEAFALEYDEAKAVYQEWLSE